MIITDRQDELGEWLCKRLETKYIKGAGQYIGLATNGVIQAVSGFEGYNNATVRGHLAIDGRMSKEFMRFCFWYVFEQLKVHKLIGLVDSNNVKAHRLDLHFGYIEEARIVRGCENGDMLILTMTKEQCKYI